MADGPYRILYDSWMTYLTTERDIADWFISSAENIREMRVTNPPMKSIRETTEWFEMKVRQEECGDSQSQTGAAHFTILGGI